jgi:aminoglycoside phosphotransferase (APT) family kinase protein
VPERHRFDNAALERWLVENLPGFHGLLEIRQFEGGQSNPTFHLLATSGEYVVRKLPKPASNATHAIAREARVLRALQGRAVPLPRWRVSCDDADVIGTPFYVMDYQPGRMFHDPLLPGLPAAERTAVYDTMNDALARVHRVGYESAGLADFGRPQGFITRQVHLWSRQVAASGLDQGPEITALARWLEAQAPPDDEACITHGDYRLGNLIFEEDAPAVAAVLDWELATIGHPLCDLAFNCVPYYLPAGHPIAPGLGGADLGALGIPSESAYTEAYARRMGRKEIPLWSYFVVFSLFRISAIQLGVYARALEGTAASANASAFGESYRMVAAAGLKIARSGDPH